MATTTMTMTMEVEESPHNCGIRSGGGGVGVGGASVSSAKSSTTDTSIITPERQQNDSQNNNNMNGSNGNHHDHHDRHTFTHLTYSRHHLVDIAKETIKIAENGYYTNNKGQLVHLKVDLDYAVEHSVHYDHEFDFHEALKRYDDEQLSIIKGGEEGRTRSTLTTEIEEWERHRDIPSRPP